MGPAAAAIDAADRLSNEDLTQREVSEAPDIPEVTVRNRYRHEEVLDAAERDTPEARGVPPE